MSFNRRVFGQFSGQIFGEQEITSGLGGPGGDSGGPWRCFRDSNKSNRKAITETTQKKPPPGPPEPPSGPPRSGLRPPTKAPKAAQDRQHRRPPHTKCRPWRVTARHGPMLSPT